MRWKEGKHFSVRLRNGKFALLRMLTIKGNVAVFNEFRDQDDWTDLATGTENLLFCCRVTRAFLARSPIQEQKDVVAATDIGIHETSISSGNGTFRQLTFWEGSPEERTIFVIGNGSNSRYRCYRENGMIREEIIPIDNADYERYRDYEMSGARAYPEFNERLVLCSEMGSNYDPLKEIAFNRLLDRRCIPYIEIISGKVLIAKYGY